MTANYKFDRPVKKSSHLPRFYFSSETKKEKKFKDQILLSVAILVFYKSHSDYTSLTKSKI